MVEFTNSVDPDVSVNFQYDTALLKHLNLKLLKFRRLKICQMLFQRFKC